MNHLNTHTLLLKSQHGYTKVKSCKTNLLLILEDVTKAIDGGNYLDLAKPLKRRLTKDFSTKLNLTE